VSVVAKPPGGPPVEAGRIEASRIVAVSNRLPITRSANGVTERASGGLVAALEPVLGAQTSGIWLGWDGGLDVPAGQGAGLPVDLVGVHLSRAEVERYYHGMANRTLWPLLHGLVEHYTLDHRNWPVYRAVNQRFAERASALANDDTLLWVHDYHLMLVPRMLRVHDADARIAFFLHVPFPPSEVWARLPWSEQIIDGLLGASHIGFQTTRFRDNFARSALLAGHATRWRDDRLLLVDGRVVDVGVHPISIDAATLAGRARGPAVARCLHALRKRFRGRQVLLGIDRLDYTKGIQERLRAFEFLLEQRRDLRGRIVLIQIAVPSRGDIREYREAREAVETAVGRINGRFTVPGGAAPVHYAHASVGPDQLLAFYQLADVCLVTSLNDGMNLVAKEYVTAQHAGDGVGVLVLSRFAGAAEELGEDALLCNPFHPEGIAGTIELALELGEDDRRARLERLAGKVARNDVYRWAERHLRAAAPVRR
jgi:alpha,alpha-trehalose-phosphate synthase [UDP-forming]